MASKYFSQQYSNKLSNNHDLLFTIQLYNQQILMQIEKDPYRFINIVLFILGAAISSMPSRVFTGVSPTISRVYGVSEVQVNSTSIIYSVVYLVMLLPANYILDKKGLKIGTLIFQITNIIGLTMRLLININYIYFQIGTFICSLGFCFMYSGASKFTSEWFPKQEIFIANSLCIFALFTSEAVGTFLGSFFIHQTSSKEQIFKFLLWQTLVMIGIQLLMILFFRGKPKTIQNYASDSIRNSYKEDLLSLLSNKNYMVIFASISFIFSNGILMFVFLPWISKFYGYANWMNGVIILSANLFGCIGCSLLGFLKQHISYKHLCITCGLGSICSVIYIFISFQLQLPICTFIGSALNGLCIYPLLSTASNFAVQTTFPVGQATSGGILLFGGHFIGALMVISFSFIFKVSSESARALLIIMIFLATIGEIILCFSEQILKRDEYQIIKLKEKPTSLVDAEEPIN